MKKVNLIVAFILIFYSSFAGSIQAIQNNGNWTSNSSWDLNRNPANNDTIIIPAGITIVITTNLNFSTNTMRILVYGTLKFSGGGAKLAIDAFSSVVVEPGGILTSTGSPSQTLTIGSNTVYNGTDAPIVGPQFANNTTGNGFVPFVVLPVKFLSFSLSYNSSIVLVQWSTAEEVNALKYQVERSIDGTNWNLVGSVSAIGNSTTTHNYTYSDHYSISKKVYYRIKEIDLSGQFNYTAIKELNSDINGDNNIKIYSPAQSTAVIEFASQFNDQVSIRIISFNGQVISEKVINHPMGQYLFNLTKTGPYIIQVSNQSNLNITKKLML